MRPYMLLLISLSFFSCGAHAASFNCAKASSKVEKLICADAELGKLDQDLAEIYKEALAKVPAVKAEQRAWLAARNQCKDTACLKTAYNDRLLELTDLIVRHDRAAMKEEETPAVKPSAAQTTKPANEVGKMTFVTEPKAEPVFTSAGNTRYWPCTGMVNAKLLKIVHAELTDISKSEGIAAPDESLCLYSIGELSLGGQRIPLFQVNHYVNAASREQCLVQDSCSDFRVMTFKVSKEKLHRQYLLTNLSKRLTRFACIDMSGNVVSATGGCP